MNAIINLVLPAGLEPATHGSEDRCSIHLSYGSTLRFLAPEQQERPLMRAENSPAPSPHKITDVLALHLRDALSLR